MKAADRVSPPLTEGPAEGCGEIGGACVVVPPGEYILAYSHYETAHYFQGLKVVVHFAIVEPDDYAGLPVERFYNVSKLFGPAKRYGDFVAPARGFLCREYNRLVGKSTKVRDISFVALKGKRVVAIIETVSRDFQHRQLSVADQYSRVAELLRVVPDDWQL